MAAVTGGGGRLPAKPRDALDDTGRAVWDALTATRGAELVGADEGLVGPFNAWVTAPRIGRHLSALGAALRFETSVDRRLIELAIITVGAHWKAEFEWWAHAAMARRHGIGDAIIDAIGRGSEPDLTADDERVVHTVARQLAETGRLDQPAWRAGRELLGDAGLVELVTLCGYYTLVSFTLNAFEVALPPGAEAQWER
jgi:4-carboxymuconolactone decarboxylase